MICRTRARVCRVVWSNKNNSSHQLVNSKIYRIFNFTNSDLNFKNFNFILYIMFAQFNQNMHFNKF